MSEAPRLRILFTGFCLGAWLGVIPCLSEEPKAARTPDEVLTSKGLKKVDKRYQLNEESSVQERFKDALPLFEEYHANVKRRDELALADQQVEEVETERQKLILWNTAAQAELNNLPQRRVIKRNNYNNLQNQQAQQIQSNKVTIKQLEIQIAQMKRALPKPGERNKLAAEGDRLRKECLDQLTLLEDAVKPLDEKYRELNKDPEVTAALSELRSTRSDSKLAPSDELSASVRQLREERRMLGKTPKRSADGTKKAARKRAGG
jgi:hypothetical protein